MRVLSFDTETYLITPTEKAPKPIVCSWYDGTKAWVTHPADAATYALWSDPDNWYTGVNLPYDLVLMMRWMPHFIPHIIRALDEGRVRDLPLRDGLIHLGTKGAIGYDPQISLLKLAKKHLGLDLSATKKGPDIWRLKYGTLDGVPFNEWPVDAMDYVLSDAKIPWQIFNQLGGAGYSPPTEVLQNQAAVVLHAIGTYGWAIDQDARQRMDVALSAQIATLEARTNHLGWTGEGSQAVMGAAVRAAWGRKHLQELTAYGEQTGVHSADRRLMGCGRAVSARGRRYHLRREPRCGCACVGYWRNAAVDTGADDDEGAVGCGGSAGADQGRDAGGCRLPDAETQNENAEHVPRAVRQRDDPSAVHAAGEHVSHGVQAAQQSKHPKKR